MKLPGNGWTKAAVLVAAGTLLFGGGSYWGWKAKVQREAVREERIDQHLVTAEKAIPRLEAVELRAAATDSVAKANAVAIADLKGEVSRLITSQERLTNTLMEYMSRQQSGP